jgi:hypothetical protein
MPNNDLHLQQYKHNRELLEIEDLKADKSNYPDWIITVLFYCAVHLVEKELSKDNKHNKRHTDRAVDIVQDTKLSVVADQYNALYMQSRRARYDCKIFSPREKFSPKDLKDAFTCLEDIELAVLHTK